MKKYLFLLLGLISVNAHAVLYYDITGGCTNLWCQIQMAPGECCPTDYAVNNDAALRIINGVAESQNSEFVGITSTPVDNLQVSVNLGNDLVIDKSGTLQTSVDTSEIDSLYVAFAAKCENEDTCQVTVSDTGAVTYSPKSGGECASDEKMVGSGTASATCVPLSVVVYNISYNLASKGKISVANPTECQFGETVYLPTVTPSDGYEFINWTRDGVSETYKAGAAITCGGNWTFTANYNTATPRTSENPNWIMITLGNTSATNSGSPSEFYCQINSKYTTVPYGCYTSRAANQQFTQMTKTPVRNNFIYKGHYVGSRQIISSNGTLTSGWKYLTTNASAEPRWDEKTIIVSYDIGNCKGQMPALVDTNQRCTVGSHLTLPSTSTLAGASQAFSQWSYNNRTASASTNRLTCTRGQLGGIAGSNVNISAYCTSTSGVAQWHTISLDPGASGVSVTGTTQYLCCDTSGRYSGWYDGGSNATCNSGNRLTSVVRPSRLGYAYKGANLGDTVLVNADGTINDLTCVASLPNIATVQWEYDGSGYYDPDDPNKHLITYQAVCYDSNGITPRDCPPFFQDKPRGDTGGTNSDQGLCIQGSSQPSMANVTVICNVPNNLQANWKCDGHVVNGTLQVTSYECPDANTTVYVRYHYVPDSVNLTYVASCADDEYCPDLSNVPWARSCVPDSNVTLSQTGTNSPLNNAYFELIGYTVDGTSTNFNFTCPEQDMTISVNFLPKEEPEQDWIRFDIEDNTYGDGLSRPQLVSGDLRYVNDGTMNIRKSSSPNVFYCQMADGIRNCPVGCYKSNDDCSDSNRFTGLTQIPVGSLSGDSYDSVYLGHGCIMSNVYNMVNSKQFFIDSEGKLTERWKTIRTATNVHAQPVAENRYVLSAGWQMGGAPIYIEYNLGDCTGTVPADTSGMACVLPSVASLAGTDQEFVGWRSDETGRVFLPATNSDWCTTGVLGVAVNGTAHVTAVCESRRWHAVELQGASLANKWICCDEWADSSNGVWWHPGGNGTRANCKSDQFDFFEKPNKDGYVFGGFKLDGTNELLIDADGNVNPAVQCNGSLGESATAQWGRGLTWTADFGGNCSGSQCPSDATDFDGYPSMCTSGNTMTVVCKELAGYDCDGWSLNEESVVSVGGTITCPNTAATITVKYHPAATAQWATITLDDNDGSDSSPKKFYCQTTPNIDGCEVGCYVTDSCTAARVYNLDTVPTREGYTYAGHYIGDYAVIELNGDEARLWSTWNVVGPGANTAVAHWTKDRYDITASCGSCTTVLANASVEPNSVVNLNGYCTPGTNQEIAWVCTSRVAIDLQGTEPNVRFNMPYADVTCNANCTLVDNEPNILNLRPFTLGSGN